jgi:hypothetical protein
MPNPVAPPAAPRATRLRVLVSIALGVALLAPTAPLAAGATPPAVGWIDAPGLTSLVEARSEAGWIDAPDDHDDHDHPGDGAGSTGTITATDPSASFTAPANTDFSLRFDASVDPATRQVITAAAGIWSAVLDVRVPIVVDVSMYDMAPGMLGAAGPDGGVHSHPSFPAPDLIYPAALANQLAGYDLNTSRPDIVMELSSAMTWDKAIDGSTPKAQSMLSVAVHELAHGLGHTSWVRPLDAGYVVNYLRNGTKMATPYDRLVATSAGTLITSLLDAAVGAAVTSPLRWNGSRGRSANEGVHPPLYSPPVFERGSSVGHLDEATFGSEVMTPFLSPREVHTTVPPITRAMMADIGWTITSSPPAGSSTTAVQQATAYVQAVTADFLGRAPTSAELVRWRDHLLAGGSREAVTRAFAYSDEWIGRLVDGLYRSTLGRSADAGGRAYWISVLRSGQTPAQVAAHFYASDEYFRRAGGTTTAWIQDLYRKVLGRTADAGGLAYWVTRAGSVSRPAIALDFYQSLESRRDRVQALFGTLLGRGPDPGGWSHWAGVLRSGRDLDLAMFLAASDEYFQRAVQRTT